MVNAFLGDQPILKALQCVNLKKSTN